MTKIDVVRRLELLETRNTLLDLVSSYAQAFDNHDPALLRSLWHEGAVLDLGGAFGRYTDIDGILAAADQLWAQTPHMHHWMANPLLEIDLDNGTATAATALDCFTTDNTTGPCQISGLYRDWFERRDGRWGIVKRTFELHYLTPIVDWTPLHGSEVNSDATQKATA
jgi:SnoaL-like domain